MSCTQSVSAPISAKSFESWAAGATTISRAEIRWQVFRSWGGLPRGYRTTPGCTLMITGCFLRYFSSRCSWHQEHHTQKQEVAMSLQKDPCTEHFILKFHDKSAIGLSRLLPRCHICAGWQPWWKAEQEGWTGAPHRTSVWRGWKYHIMEDSCWLQPSPTRCKQGKGSTRTHSSLKKKQSLANPEHSRRIKRHKVWKNAHTNCSYRSMKRGRCSSWSMGGPPLSIPPAETRKPAKRAETPPPKKKL